MRKRRIILLIAFGLILVDWLFKFLLLYVYPDLNGEWIPLYGFLYLHPVYNLDGNWLNSTFSVGFHPLVFCVFCILGLLIGVFLTAYLEFRISRAKVKNQILIYPYLFLLSILSRLVVVVSGDYVLDYISIHLDEWVVTFDLCDLYLLVSMIGIVGAFLWLGRKEKLNNPNKRTFKEQLLLRKQERDEFLVFLRSLVKSSKKV